MDYEGTLYRPPSEADSFILQATIGCSWNACTYCAMYRDKQFRVRALDETLEAVGRAGRQLGSRVDKVFGTASCEHWTWPSMAGSRCDRSRRGGCSPS